MTQLERLKKRIPEEPDDGVLEDVLESAKNIILGRRYPFDEWPEDVEPRYQDLQIRIAVDMYNRIGAEGQIAHSENGISRSWGEEWVSGQLLREIVPYAGVI